MVQLLYEHMTDLWEFAKCICYAKPPLFPFPGLHHPLNRAPSSHVPGTLVGAFEFVVFGVSMLIFTTDRLLTTSMNAGR